MKNIQILLLAIIATFIATSCTVEHTVDFNEDMSGNNSVSMDMSEMMAMVKAMQPDSEEDGTAAMFGDYNMEEEMADLQKEFKKAEGLSNLQLVDKVDKGIFGMSFDFENVKAITQGMNKADSEKKSADDKAADLFVLGKNNLKVNFSTSSFKDAFGGSEKEETEGEDLMAGFSMGDYALTLNFPFPIKAVDNELYLISEDKKSVSFVVPIETITDETKNLNAQIEW